MSGIFPEKARSRKKKKKKNPKLCVLTGKGLGGKRLWQKNVRDLPGRRIGSAKNLGRIFEPI